ncbi:MAG TPA: hypothetical protein ACFYD2_04425 [Candidatus Avalokitesvara rifleensis]|nr:hypothetical protein [Candidatus Brocadiales bacterium]
MIKKRRLTKFPRLECPSEKVFKDKKRKRTKRPTAEELGDTKDNLP